MNDKVKEVIEKLELDQQLTPANLVKEAEKLPEGHPLHDAFEWEDSKAGPLYREHQARTLIRGVKINMTIHRVKMSVPVYVHDPSLPQGVQGYVSTMRIKTDEEKKAEALEAEIARVENAADRAREIGHALGIDEADIDAQLAEAVRLNGGGPASMSAAA